MSARRLSLTLLIMLLSISMTLALAWVAPSLAADSLPNRVMSTSTPRPVAPYSSKPNGFDVVGSTLYFIVSTAEGANSELWKSDGTAEGTVFVKRVKRSVGEGTSIGMQGMLYFSANDPTYGCGLWKSDGTSGGTIMVKSIATGTCTRPPSLLTPVNGRLFFAAEGGLWRSDGTAQGTVLIKNVSPSWLRGVAGRLFFSAGELWVSDGTPAGTSVVKDIYPGAEPSNPFPLAVVQERLFFSADDGLGRKLWKSNGTSTGTILVKDVRPNTYSYGQNKTSVALGNRLFFTNGASLWVSDGTEAGTQQIASFSDYTLSLVLVNQTIFIYGHKSLGDTRLWKSDGTSAGTVLVKQVAPYPHFTPFHTTSINDLFLFTSSAALWKSDGTPEGTVPIKVPRSSAGTLDELSAPRNGTIFFPADDGVHGVELWKSDGTPEGTVLVKDIYLQPDPSPTLTTPSPTLTTPSPTLTTPSPSPTLIPTPTPGCGSTSAMLTPTPSQTATPTRTLPGHVLVFSDDFERDRGWIVNPNGSDTATLGQWERGDPEATFYNGAKQLGTTMSGSNDLVTGRLAGSGTGAYDIDGGVTSIQSPCIRQLPPASSLQFHYYLAHAANATSGDYLRVKIVSGSSTTTVFERRGAASDIDAQWQSARIELSPYSGKDIRILIEAADGDTASLVEAALDDVTVTFPAP